MPDLYQTEKVQMTDDDRNRMNEEHVKTQLELETLKEEKRDVSSVYRVKIRELEEKIHTLATQLDEGEFDRRFEVTEEPDDERLMMDIKRADTGERVTTRQMTEVEKDAARKRKQTSLDFEGEGEDGDTEPPTKLRGLRGGNGKPKKAKRR